MDITFVGNRPKMRKLEHFEILKDLALSGKGLQGKSYACMVSDACLGCVHLA